MKTGGTRTTALQLTCLERQDGGLALTYLPSHLHPCSHSWLPHVGLEWKHESYPAFTSVKEQRKMTLPFYPRLAVGGTVYLKGVGRRASVWPTLGRGT